MAENRVTIDPASVLDNEDERQVEFEGEIDGDEYQFALDYDVLEALSGDAPDNDAVALFERFSGKIEQMAASALARDTDQTLVMVTEDDLE